MGIDLMTWIKAGLPPALTIESGRLSPPQERHDPQEDCPTATNQDDIFTRPDLPPDISELRTLLRRNPGTKIINKPERYTVLRNGRFVGGRINELVFLTPALTNYLLSHPAEEINEKNLIV
jgi:hypothetical protein